MRSLARELPHRGVEGRGEPEAEQRGAMDLEQEPRPVGGAALEVD